MAKKRSNDTPPRVVGAAPLGVTRKVTDQMVRDFSKQLSQGGRTVTVKAIRFIPSSRTMTDTGSFQVVANNFVEITPSIASSPRLETMDSVVTVGRTGGVQKLEGLSIPALERFSV
jgi:hypothetical protein